MEQSRSRRIPGLRDSTGKARNPGKTGASAEVGTGLHKMTPPYHPNLQADDDTRHFDDDIPNEVHQSLLPCLLAKDDSLSYRPADQLAMPRTTHFCQTRRTGPTSLKFERSMSDELVSQAATDMLLVSLSRAGLSRLLNPMRDMVISL